jgi:hypothetical protein
MNNYINLKEVRVGNHLEAYAPIINEWIVIEVDGNTMLHINNNSESYRGLPLTRYLCASIRCIDNSYGQFILPINTDLWIMISYDENEIIQSVEISDVVLPYSLIYLHQLQNLYRSLTNKELEFTKQNQTL